MNATTLLRQAGCIALVSTLGSLSPAALAATYDFVSGDTTVTQNGTGYGNSITAVDDGLSVEIYGFGATGGSGSLEILESAEIYAYNIGLGVCNRSEGEIGNGCRTNSGRRGNRDDEHQVDNVSADDFVLFLFDEEVSFDTAEIDPFNTQDTDVSFWVGDVNAATVVAELLTTVVGNPGITNTGLEAAGFSQQYDQMGDHTYLPVTVDLLDLEGNALLIAGRRDTGAPDDDDRFKITGLNVTPTMSAIPVPPAVWLFGSGLVALLRARRST